MKVTRLLLLVFAMITLIVSLPAIVKAGEADAVSAGRVQMVKAAPVEELGFVARMIKSVEEFIGGFTRFFNIDKKAEQVAQVKEAEVDLNKDVPEETVVVEVEPDPEPVKQAEIRPLKPSEGGKITETPAVIEKIDRAAAANENKVADKPEIQRVDTVAAGAAIHQETSEKISIAPIVAPSPKISLADAYEISKVQIDKVDAGEAVIEAPARLEMAEKNEDSDIAYDDNRSMFANVETPQAVRPNIVVKNEPAPEQVESEPAVVASRTLSRAQAEPTAEQRQIVSSGIPSNVQIMSSGTVINNLPTSTVVNRTAGSSAVVASTPTSTQAQSRVAAVVSPTLPVSVNRPSTTVGGDSETAVTAPVSGSRIISTCSRLEGQFPSDGRTLMEVIPSQTALIVTKEEKIYAVSLCNNGTGFSKFIDCEPNEEEDEPEEQIPTSKIRSRTQSAAPSERPLYVNDGILTRKRTINFDQIVPTESTEAAAGDDDELLVICADRDKIMKDDSEEGDAEDPGAKTSTEKPVVDDVIEDPSNKTIKVEGDQQIYVEKAIDSKSQPNKGIQAEEPYLSETDGEQASGSGCSLIIR